MYRFDDGDAATSYAEVAVAADEPARAIEVLLAHGIDPHQLWDLGRTPCAVPADVLDRVPEPGAVLVRRHDLDGSTTGWQQPRTTLDRRRRVRTRAGSGSR